MIATAKKTTHPSIGVSVESMMWLKQAVENWGDADADDDDDDDADAVIDDRLETQIKERLPSGVRVKVSPKKIVLKTFKGNGKYLKQSSINRVMFDDEAALKIAVDTMARGLMQMKRTADDIADDVRNAGEDVE